MRKIASLEVNEIAITLFQPLQRCVGKCNSLGSVFVHFWALIGDRSLDEATDWVWAKSKSRHNTTFTTFKVAQENASI